MTKQQPVRIADGEALPHKPFWAWRDAAEVEPELELYGWISEYSWFEDEITPKMFKDDLNRYGKGGPVTVRIHSGGGDVFAASVMRAILLDYPGPVKVKIDGLCASAATIVAMAGKRIMMQESAYMMIHDPSTVVMGNIETLKAVLDELKVCKAGIVDAYASRTGLERGKLERMMTDETWMTAREAREMGFVDEVISGPVSQTASAVITNSLSRYVHVPEALRQAQAEPKAPVESPDAVRLRAEVKLLM
jgi:ATP-dependent Clp protease protease subunit